MAKLWTYISSILSKATDVLNKLKESIEKASKTTDDSLSKDVSKKLENIKDSMADMHNNTVTKSSENLNGINDVFSKSLDYTSKGIFAKKNETTESIAQNHNNISSALTDIFNRKMSAMLSNIDFDETLDAIDKYQKESGKDVADLTDFINKLKNVK